MLRMQMRQNISYLLKNAKIQVYSISRILNLLLNIQMIWMIFIKLLWNTIQIKITRYWLLSNNKISPIVVELFIRDKKLISFVFIMKSYFSVSKNIRLNSSQYFIIKIPSKRESQQIAFNHSWDIDFRNIWKKFTVKPYLFW